MFKEGNTDQQSLLGCILGMQAQADTSAEEFLHDVKPAQKGSQGFYYINNPDGSIRWFFPKKNASPVFLSLYNSASIKANIYRQAMKFAYAIGQEHRLMSGQFSLASSTAPQLSQLVSSLGCDEYACFTGTAGENRKSVIACGPASNPDYFVKIAHTPKAAALLKREKEVLTLLGKTDWKHLKHPIVQEWDSEQALILDNVKPRSYRSANRLTKEHLKALAELSRKGARKQLGDLVWYQQVQEDLDFLREGQNMNNDLDQAQVKRLLVALGDIYQKFSPASWIETNLAHGDFTPWNSYLAPNRVHVYDWELADEQFPAFFDLFHFHYQSGCLLRRQSPDRLDQELNKLLETPYTREILGEGCQQAKQYQKLYLLITVSRYLRMYSLEETVLTQAHWLLDTWENALKTCL